jgi:hypothetical protein
VPDSLDNCPGIANDQANADGDAYGDLCDEDIDGDGVPNAADNCPARRNPTQLDLDADASGDACDLDMDGDSVLDDVDNCPIAKNKDQEDNDGDGIGDVCILAGLEGNGPAGASSQVVRDGEGASLHGSAPGLVNATAGLAIAAVLGIAVVTLAVLALRRKS